jgi:hypothetical protein
MDRVSAHDLRRAFARESVPHQVTVASAQGEATDSGVADDSAGGGQPECPGSPGRDWRSSNLKGALLHQRPDQLILQALFGPRQTEGCTYSDRGPDHGFPSGSRSAGPETRRLFP